ncbi:MAG: hypothetical protein U0K54_00665 [Acutalibacteraceae bacterium]|nr:hypothetical protein [Acutalibacteraceae bacterium]
MFMILFIIVGTLLLARDISGYDSRYNSKKYFVLKNKEVAKILLPKSVGWQRSVKRLKSDFNKMTYIGATFYICNVLLILSIPVFLFLVPDIKVSPFEIDARYLYIFVDTLNQKLPVLFAFLLLAVEIVFEFINVLWQSKKQNKKGIVILSSILMIIIGLFGVLQVKELISTIIEVF